MANKEKHVLKIEPDSEAERYFIGTFMPICKDQVAVRLGEIWGWSYNEYEFTHEDFERCRDYIKNRDRDQA